MTEACATLAEVLTVAPAIAPFGTQGTAQLTVVTADTGTEVLTFTDATGVIPVVETYTSGTDWTPGVTQALTAVAIATALAASSLIIASAVGDIVFVASVATGALSLIDVASSGATMTWNVTTLENGDAALNQVLGCACQMINLQCWGVKADCGHIYLTAHMVTVAQGGDVGQVTMKKIDKISSSFSAASFDTSDAAFASTHWGRMYLAERETIVVFPVVGTGLPRFWPRRFFGPGRRRF